MFAFDIAAFGLPLLPRSLSCSGPSSSPCSMSQLGLLLLALDSSCLGPSFLLKSLQQSGALILLSGTATADSPAPLPDMTCTESSLTMRSSGRLASPMSTFGLSCLDVPFLAIDMTYSGFVLLLKAPQGLGPAFLLCGMG